MLHYYYLYTYQSSEFLLIYTHQDLQDMVYPSRFTIRSSFGVIFVISLCLKFSQVKRHYQIFCHPWITQSPGLTTLSGTQITFLPANTFPNTLARNAPKNKSIYLSLSDSILFSAIWLTPFNNKSESSRHLPILMTSYIPWCLILLV